MNKPQLPAVSLTGDAAPPSATQPPADSNYAGGQAQHLPAGTPHGSAPVTPSASCVSEDSDLTHGQQWWLPQPKPSLGEEHKEWRPAVPLAEALQCKVCSDLFKEPITAAECGHSYCYDCIDERITIGGRANFCPVCNILLGPNPFEHNKLKYDFTLDSLVRKIFPRPLLDAALEARRLEREEATRQAKANVNKRPARLLQGRVTSSSQLAGLVASRPANAAGGSADVQQVELALFPLPADGSSAYNSMTAGAGVVNGTLAVLPKPYLRAPGLLTVAALRSWLTDRLAGKKADAYRLNLQLECVGQQLDLLWTLQQVYLTFWKPHCDGTVAGSSAATGTEVAAAAATPGTVVQQKSGDQELINSGGSRVMLIYYSKGEDIE